MLIFKTVLRAHHACMQWVDDHRIVGDARGLGLLLGISIVDAKTRDLDQKLAEAVYYETIRKGV